MKKALFLLIFSSLFVVLSCSREAFLETDSHKTINLQIEAVNGYHPDTKTCLSTLDSTRVLWSPYDSISLFYACGQNDSYSYVSSLFKSSNSDTSNFTTFNGSILLSSVTGFLETGESSSPLQFYGVYPSDAGVSVQDDTVIVLDIRSQQSACSGSIPEGQFPAVGRTPYLTLPLTLRMPFYNVCGGLCFSLTRSDVKKLTFTALDGKPLAGRCNVFFDSDGLPSISSFSDASSSVSITMPDGSAFEPNTGYYMALAPSSIDSLRISLFTDDSKADTVLRATDGSYKKINVKRNVFGRLKDFDADMRFITSVKSVELDIHQLTLREDDTCRLCATVLPETATDPTLKWSVSPEDVATVSEDGLVTALKYGNCTIVATSNFDPSIYDSCSLEVIPQVDYIEVSGRNSLQAGQSFSFTAEVFPSDAKSQNVIWSSSDTTIAEVSESGVVTGKGDGNCYIVAASERYPFIRDSIKVTVIVIKNLDKDGYANCYIINAPGIYEFAPVQGISGKGLDDVSSVEILWEYVSSAVRASSFATGAIVNSAAITDDGRIRLYTPENLLNGNALVVVRNSDGVILWSWHIWVVEGYDILDSSILCNEGNDYLMDRHLGAVSAEPGTANCLVYQWGRKDPFPATDERSVYTRRSASWGVVSSTAATGTIEYATNNPTTFITKNSNNDWYYSNDAVKGIRWTSSSKSEYDPCPYGWRVPSGEFWSTAVSDGTPEWNSAGVGVDLGSLMGVTSAWFQSTGYAYRVNATMVGSDRILQLWSSTYSSPKASSFYIHDSGSMNKNCRWYCASGLSVRCIKE